MRFIRHTWFGGIFLMLIIAIGRAQKDDLGTALALIVITLVMIGMSLLAEWYAGGRNHGEL